MRYERGADVSERGASLKNGGACVRQVRCTGPEGNRRAVFGLERRVASPHVNHAGSLCWMLFAQRGEGRAEPGRGLGGAQDAAPSGTERERSALEYRSAAACSLGPVAIRGS